MDRRAPLFHKRQGDTIVFERTGTHSDSMVIPKRLGTFVFVSFLLAAHGGRGFGQASSPAAGLLESGKVKLAQGDPEGALQAFSKAVALDPKLEDAWINRGLIRKDKGDLQGAISDYSAAIDLHGRNAHRARYNRGNARLALGDYQKAYEDYSQALELHPDYALAYASRGIARKNPGDLDGALDDYTQAICLDPNTAASTHLNRGMTRAALGDLRGAAADFTRAIDLDPTYAKAYVCRAEVRAHEQDRGKAEEDFRQALELKPNSPEFLFARATARLNMSDTEGAIADYDRVLAVDPTSIEALTGRGYARRDRGDNAGALEDFSKALAADPNNGGACRGRGLAHYDRGEWDSALADFEKACDSRVREPYMRLRIWILRARQGQRTVADVELQRCVKASTPEALTGWPRTLAEFLLGTRSEDHLLKATGAGDARESREQLCEAYFYAASKRLCDGDTTAATGLFRKCVATGVANFSEWTSAQAELERLQQRE